MTPVAIWYWGSDRLFFTLHPHTAQNLLQNWLYTILFSLIVSSFSVQYSCRPSFTFSGFFSPQFRRYWRQMLSHTQRFAIPVFCTSALSFFLTFLNHNICPHATLSVYVFTCFAQPHALILLSHVWHYISAIYATDVPLNRVVWTVVKGKMYLI